MIPLHRLFCLGCLVALLTSFTQAQTPAQTDTSDASSSPGGWSATEDPKAVAWRAYDAMLTGDESAIPQLLSVVSRWQPLARKTLPGGSTGELATTQKEQRDAMTVVLDALIQLHASVPAYSLRNLAPDFGSAVAVILARMPAQESELLAQEFFTSAESGDTVQYVSAALLALHPPPGFAGKLLGGITVRATVIAMSPGMVIGLGSSQGDCGGYPLLSREDWPAVGHYGLSTQMSEGASVLVSGNEPIYVSREESSHYFGDERGGGCGGLYLGAQEKRDLVAEILDVPAEQIPWETDLRASLDFTSLGEFSAEVLGFIQEQDLMYIDTAKALQARGLLTAAEVSQSLPMIEVCLEDERRMRPVDEDSDDPHPHDNVQIDLEPISKDAIKLPARVMWSPYACF